MMVLIEIYENLMNCSGYFFIFCHKNVGIFISIAEVTIFSNSLLKCRMSTWICDNIKSD